MAVDDANTSVLVCKVSFRPSFSSEVHPDGTGVTTLILERN